MNYTDNSLILIPAIETSLFLSERILESRILVYFTQAVRKIEGILLLGYCCNFPNFFTLNFVFSLFFSKNTEKHNACVKVFDDQMTPFYFFIFEPNGAIFTLFRILLLAIFEGMKRVFEKPVGASLNTHMFMRR